MRIFVSVLVRLGLTALAFGITSWALSGVELSGGVLGALWVSLLFGALNVLLGAILRTIVLPVGLVTLGLFSLVVNALLLWVTDALTGHLSIDEFWWTAIWASLILAVVLVVLEFIARVFFVRRLDDLGPAVST